MPTSDQSLTQIAALLYTIVTHLLPGPCTLEQMEAQLHRLSQEIARRAAEQWAQAQVADAERVAPCCGCGRRMWVEQRRSRSVLLLFGLIQGCWRRYRCPACGAWQCPAAARLGVAPRHRMTWTLQEVVCHFGLSWSYQVAKVLLARVLPVAGVSAKTIERVAKRSATARQAQEDAAARRCLEDPRAAGSLGLPAFAHPERIYGGLDGILVRARGAKQRLEIQVASLWSGWKELLDRKTPRRLIRDRTLIARAGGWDQLGEQVWRVFVGRGGLRQPPPEVVILGDGAAGIRSLWELYFPHCRALLDPWHLWEKVKERAREVIGHRERALGAAQVVYERLKRGALQEARELIDLWPATSERARQQRERLLAYLERNQDIIQDYEHLREQGYMVGSGLTEKANDLVVVPRMKNGKMHWSRAGANAVALLRAQVLNDPDGPLLPT